MLVKIGETKSLILNGQLLWKICQFLKTINIQL